MNVKRIILVGVLLCISFLAACDGSPTVTPVVETKDQTQLPETIIQEVTIQDRSVPVINASGQSEVSGGPGQSSTVETQPSQNQPGAPPQGAIDACANLNLDDACSFDGFQGTVEGTCLEIHSSLACVPEGGPPPGAPNSEGP